MTSARERPSIYQIARKTRVSIATVSRVLNNKPSVSPSTRRAILKCMEEARYTPRLVKVRTTSLGVLLDYRAAAFTNYAGEVINGIFESALSDDFRFTILSTSEQDIASRGLLESLRAGDIEGVVVLMSHDDSPYLQELEDERFPYIVVNNRRDGFLHSVDVDNRHGIHLAMEHLASLGHNRIAFLGGDTGHHDLRTRFETYQAFRSERGLALDPGLVAPGVDAALRQNHLAEGRARTAALLESGTPFTALVCATDDLAFGALRALRERSRRVPEDVSVTGFDDYEMTAYMNPALTTVRQPLRRIGATAAREVLRMVAAARSRERAVDRRHVGIVLQPELIVRESTARPGHANQSASRRRKS